MGVEVENSTNEILAMSSAEPCVSAPMPCLDPSHTLMSAVLK